MTDSSSPGYVGAAGVALALPLARLLLDAALLRPLARRLLLDVKLRATGASLPQKENKRLDKFCESGYKLAAYGSLLAVGVWALRGQPWLAESAEWWRGWPHQPLDPRLVVYYAVQLGFYACSIIMHMFWETRRKDFAPMLIHHVAALVLVALSYHLRFMRVGAVILALHDVSDVLLEAAKLLNYCEPHLGDAPSTAVFVLFMASWFLLRLVYFPFWIIWSTSIQLPEVLGHVPPSVPLFNLLLLLLLVLHVYWFALIVKVAVGKLRTGSNRDVREDDDD